ncbi:hypothetical protein [Calothrix sp. NIES-2100]|uniref:hypothetical protein n=1 Tax=Calothrix sp. NIES-2100 TaxID=1954172 RepID=UPI000BBBF262
MLGNKSAGNYPDHWIVFLGGLAIDNTAETINFQCYSWGKTITVSKQQDDFEDYMFGVVTGI